MLDLKNWAFENGYKIAWGNIKYLNNAYEEFESQFISNKLNELQSSVFKSWRFDNEAGPDFKTIIIVAASAYRMTREIIFNFNGTEIAALMPPFYDNFEVEKEFDTQIEARLSQYIKSYGCEIKRLSGPLKNLSAQLGLGKYGRNNLIYVDKFGSYSRLIGFVTNERLTPEIYPGVIENKNILDSCKKCDLCSRNCPTQAICKDEFQLHVDDCLAYLNEKPEDWTESIKNIKQHYLVGCLNCQYICPHNKGITENGSTTSVYFNEYETDFIMGKSKNTSKDIIASAFEKLNKAGLSRYKEYILRNIRIYIKNSS